MPRVGEISDRMLARARAAGDPLPLLTAHYKCGAHHFFGGGFEQARDHYEQAVALSAAHGIERSITPERADVVSRVLLGGALWHLGYPDRARRVCDEAIALARATRQPLTIVAALVMAAKWTFVSRGDVEVAWRCLDEALAMCHRHALPWWQAIALMTRATLVACGRAPAMVDEAPAAAVATLRAVIAAFQAAGTRIGLPDWQKELAASLLHQGRVGEARDAIAAGLDIARATMQAQSDAELHRLSGEAALLASPASEMDAERGFLAALDIARRQRARSLELRAAMSLGALRTRQGRSAEGRALVEGVLTTFTEGCETADLRRAGALLGTPA
jgi:hypothetical protein